MSKTGAINISVENKSNYTVFLNNLMNNHWSPNKYGEISYMINGTFDWQSTSIDNFNNVYSLIKQSIENKLETAIDLIWEDNLTIIGLLFINNNSIMITISENIKRIQDNTNVDFPFYLEKLAPIIQLIKPEDFECVYN